jgi:phosphate transport system permease protein
LAALTSLEVPSAEFIERRDAQRKLGSRFVTGLCEVFAAVIAIIAVGIIGTIVVRGMPAMSAEFLSKPPVEGMKAGGIWPMIQGSVLLMLGTMLFVLPVGVLGGIFLAEYAGRNQFFRITQACVTALAGTPSIVFGLFGLAIFVLLLEWKFCLLAGWMTLALFSLPTIVLTTENSIRAVPDSLVEGALSLGLSKWQTIWKVVLPNAMPGILSGIILTTGRAAGEAPPILLTAGIYYTTENLKLSGDTLFKPVMNLPYHLAEAYRQGGSIPDRILWGTCLVLLLFVLFLNLGAIVLRARMRWKQQAQ